MYRKIIIIIFNLVRYEWRKEKVEKQIFFYILCLKKKKKRYIFVIREVVALGWYWDVDSCLFNLWSPLLSNKKLVFESCLNYYDLIFFFFKQQSFWNWSINLKSYHIYEKIRNKIWYKDLIINIQFQQKDNCIKNSFYIKRIVILTKIFTKHSFSYKYFL